MVVSGSICSPSTSSTPVSSRLHPRAMAYITQKQFFQPSFWNEDPKLPSRKRSEGVLKSYSSCSDTRAWSLDLQKQSQFITDVAHRVLSQAGKVPLHSFSGAELTKDYLVRLDADSLADYILSLRGETKRNVDTIEKLNETNTNLSNQNEVLSQKLGVLEVENKQLHDEIERIGRCQEQQKATNTFDEEELIEISKQIFDLSERNEDLEDEIRELRFQLNARQPAESSHGDHGDQQQAVLEAENNFLKFKSHEYEKLESELCMFKAEFDSLKQQKRELSAEVQWLQRYRVRSAELKKELNEELHNREVCEDQIEMLVNMYEQQSVELNQLKDQLKSHQRGTEESLYDESVNGNNDSEVSVAEPRSVQGEGQNLTSQPCQSCVEYTRKIQQLEEQVQVVAASASIYESQHAENADTSVLELQVEDLQRELHDCQARLKEATEQYATLRESSLADCQELGRLKLQLDQMARVDCTSDASRLAELEDKLKKLQDENETLRNQQIKDQPADGSSKCCTDKEKQIAELQEMVSRLQLATSERQHALAELETLRVKNATLEERIAALDKQLETVDQRANEVQRALDAQLSGQPGGERLSACLTELTTEKNETIERLKVELESLQTTNAKLENELHACQKEGQELRNILEQKGTAAEEAETMEQVVVPDVLLSPKEELASLVDEKEAEGQPEAAAGREVGDEVPGQDVCASDAEAVFVVKQQSDHSLSRSSADRCKKGNRVIHALAVKIVGNGIDVLLVAELYVLLREVCSVIAHKNAILGRNVTVLANSMSECWQVITDARVMMDKEIERTAPMVPRCEGIDVRVTCHGGHRGRTSRQPRQSGAVPLPQTRSADSDECKQFPTNLDGRRRRCTMKWKEPGAKRTNR
ncbi:GRIP and coiled-coil domain-containing protein 2-like [Anopheles albimanus]|nr:GRIP and coiled-coil domain-containing protein 2-like [Anopheles albimanus]